MKKTLPLIVFSALGSFVASMSAAEKFSPQMDLNKNGEVTEAEYLSFWKERYQKMDKNGDKLLDNSELKVKNFASWDTGKDGTVDLKEFSVVRKRHFKAKDENGDGVLK